MEDAKASTDISICIGSALGSEDFSSLFEKTLDEYIRRGTFVIAISPDGLLGNRGDAIDFSDYREHGCCERDKDCQLVEKKEAVKQTCADCVNQDEDLTTVAGSGITLCSDRQIHVPLTSPACDWFVQVSKDENEPEPNETLQEKTKTIAETISDLYYQIASLDSQKEALKSANEELLGLSNNCPDCEEYCEIADAVEEENMILRDHNASLVKSKKRMSGEIQAHCLASERESEIIANLQRRLQAEVKENEILANSLSAAETALGIHEDTIDQLTKKNATLLRDYKFESKQARDMHNQLRRAEEEYMKLADAQSLSPAWQEAIKSLYGKAIKGN